MKKILFIVAFLCSFTMYADSTSVNIQEEISSIQNLPDSAKVTFTTVYNDVKEAISGIAASLKVGAEYVWTILIKQQIVKGLVYLILLTISLILIISFYKACKNSKEDWLEHGDPTPIGIMRIIQIVTGLCLFVISINNLDVILTGLINPEYGAMSDIMNWVRK